MTTNELAGVLETRPASITDMMKKLKIKKLVNYQKYRGFSLTPEGKRIALRVVRRHRLWEYFLAEKLRFNWEEVHEIAEDLEHVSNTSLIRKLDAYLGHPKSDPHGDPIPDEQGKMPSIRQISLVDLQPNRWAKIAKVTNPSAGLMEMLKLKNLRLGSRIEVKKRFPFDNSLEIRTSSQPSLTISEQVAKNIYVKQLK